MRDRLYNRRHMETHVGMLVEQAQSRGTPLTLLVLDIDYFKSINDTYDTMPDTDLSVGTA